MAAGIILSPRRRKIGKKVAYLYPFDGNGHPTLYWAENGMVAYEDRRSKLRPDQRCGTLPWDRAERRMKAVISSFLMSSSEAKEGNWIHAMRRLRRWFEDMQEVIREAKEYGLPATPPTRYRLPKIVPRDGDVDF